MAKAPPGGPLLRAKQDCCPRGCLTPPAPDKCRCLPCHGVSACHYAWDRDRRSSPRQQTTQETNGNGALLWCLEATRTGMPERAAKSGAAHRSKAISEMTRAAISKAKKGQKHSAESRRKMSESQKRRVRPPRGSSFEPEVTALLGTMTDREGEE